MTLIFFINLDKDADRRQSIETQLSLAGLCGERIAGINGRLLPEWAASYFPPSNLRPGEVGCYASHMLVWRAIVSRKLPYALVLEDDVRIPPDFAGILDEIIRSLPPGWDFVHIAAPVKARPFAFRPLETLRNGSRLVRYSRIPSSTEAYLISASGAAKLLSAVPRTVPVDFDTRRPWKWGLDCYGIEPGPIGRTQRASTIGAIAGHSRLRRGVIGGVTYSLRSPASAVFNIRKLGLAWWTWCLAQNAAHKLVRAFLGWRLANRLLPLGNNVETERKL